MAHESEGIGGGAGAEFAPTSVVPEQTVVWIGESKTLPDLVRYDLGMKSVKVSFAPVEIIDIPTGTEKEPEPLKNRRDALLGRVRVGPLLEDEVTKLTVQSNGHSAESMVQVRPERETVEVLPPEAKQIERQRYRVVWGKRKEVRLLAPIEFVAEHGATLRVFSSGLELSLWMGSESSFCGTTVSTT